MHRLEIKLKQHTPMIHFQHDQEGATLRATEVKPKLDKYILTKLGNGNYELGAQTAKERGWLVGKGDHYALDYKMRIDVSNIEIWDINEIKPYSNWHRQNGKQSIHIGTKDYLAKKRRSDGKLICDLKQYPLYFANMDADYTNANEYRRFSFTEEPIQLTFLVMEESLYQYLNDAYLLNDFFFQTNFGTRQSKGFGSFFISEDDSLFQSRQSKYRFIIDASKWDDLKTINDEYERVFEYIDIFYKSLRGGINQKSKKGTEFYFKSLAYMYANEILNAKWDKRAIKEQFYGIKRGNYSQAYDVRDMLGFSTNEQWLSYSDAIEKKSVIADRMMSPILFKPLYDDSKCRYSIHILFQEKKVNMDGFKEGKCIKVISKKRKKFFNLDIPKTFSTNLLFEYIFKQSNFDVVSHVDELYHNHRYFLILDDIYTQIKNNIYI